MATDTSMQALRRTIQLHEQDEAVTRGSAAVEEAVTEEKSTTCEEPSTPSPYEMCTTNAKPLLSLFDITFEVSDSSNRLYFLSIFYLPLSRP
jgi:hypothetical protein